MNKILYISILITAAFFILSCDDMNDLHEGYLAEGEIIYAAQVDSVSIHTGYYRAELELLINSQRIEKVRIFWNDYADSSDISIGSQTGVFFHLLDDMDERDYIFHCVSLDKYDNPSLPFELTGTVYGENYKTQLSNRRVSLAVTAVDSVENVLSLTWTTLSSLDQGVTMEYFNADSTWVQLDVPADEQVTYIESWFPETTFRYSTLYKPTEDAIDVFEADYTEGTFPEMASE